MRLYNILTENQQTILETLEGWEVLGGVATARASVRNYKHTPGALQLDIESFVSAESSPDREDVEVRTIRGEPDFPGLTVIPGQYYRAFAWVKPDSPITVHLQICFYDVNDDLIVEALSQDMEFLGEHRQWHLVSVEASAPADTSYAQVCLKVPEDMNEAPCTIFMDDIVLTPYRARWSPFHLLCLLNIPEYIRLADIEQTNPTFPLSRFLSVATVDAERIFKAAIAFDRAPASDRVPEEFQNCTLVDPTAYPQEDVAEARWLPWLAQVTGTVNLNSDSAGLTTTWSTLEAAFATWSALEYQVDELSTEFSFGDGSLSSLSRDSNVVSAVVSDASRVAVGQTVAVSGDPDWAGTEFVVESVVGNTVTWADAGTDGFIDSGVIVVSFTDTEWSELEVARPASFDTTAVLSHLIRTGGTGLWAGTFEGIRRAVRSILRGQETEATLTRDGNGNLSIALDASMTVPVDANLDIYLCDDATFDGRISVVSGSDDGRSIAATQDGPAGVRRALVSERLVDVDVPDSVGAPYVIRVKTPQSVSPDVSVILTAARLAKPAGWSVVHEYFE